MTSRKTAERGGRQVAARGGPKLAERRVIATRAARQAVSRLRAARGPLMFVQSAGCCGGSVPMCFPAGEYLTGPGDLLLGSVAGCPFYMDARQYGAWHPGQLVLDVEPGMPEGFSLTAGEGLHFVTRTGAQPPAAGSPASRGTLASAKSARAEVDEVIEKGEGGEVMSFTGVSSLDASIDRANAWLADIDEGFGTRDRRLAYRVLRAWLHCLRDRLTVEMAAHFAAQLPELLRGVFFDGWNPDRVPQKYDRAEYLARFAREARVRDSDVVKSARIVTAVARRHLSAGLMTHALGLLPADLRDLLDPATAGQGPAAGR